MAALGEQQQQESHKKRYIAALSQACVVTIADIDKRTQERYVSS